MGAEKPRTTDEYVLAELEKQKNLNLKLKKENEALELELAKKVPIPDEPTITECPFKCYSYHVPSSYSSDWDHLNDPLTTDQMQELLDNDSKFRAWGLTAMYKDTYSNMPVLRVAECGYNFEINYYGTIIGIHISKYLDNSLSVGDYIVDEKHNYHDYTACQEAGLSELKKTLAEVIARRRKKEAEAAAKAAEAKVEETTTEEKK